MKLHYLHACFRLIISVHDYIISQDNRKEKSGDNSPHKKKPNREARCSCSRIEACTVGSVACLRSTSTPCACKTYVAGI